MRWATPILALALIGCGAGGGPSSSRPSPTPSASASSAPSGSPTVSPSASPTGPAALPLGVVVKDFIIDGGANYSVSLVGVNGRVAATASGRKRGQPAGVLVQMPSISASNSRLYYLDGDSTVMFLMPDGTTGTATTVSVDSNSAAVFSVSPDDSRIAVAVITFPYPAKTRIYVEDVQGAGHHIELFSSNTVLEWPVGWHEGHLVIAVGLNAHPQNAWDGFIYGYKGYHLADAATGTRLATICDGFTASNPPVAAGTVCTNGTNYEVSDWSGATRAAPADNGCGGGVLSPDGSLIADCQGSSRTITLVARDGTQIGTQNSGIPLGWIDSTRLVITTADLDMSIVDTRAFTTTHVQAQGFFGGAIPGGL